LTANSNLTVELNRHLPLRCVGASGLDAPCDWSMDEPFERVLATVEQQARSGEPRQGKSAGFLFALAGTIG
jgi:hypothetical protein